MISTDRSYRLETYSPSNYSILKQNIQKKIVSPVPQ